MGWPELIRIRNSSFYPLNSYNHSIRPLRVLSYLPVKGLCGFRIMEYRSVYYAQYSEHVETSVQKSFFHDAFNSYHFQGQRIDKDL